MSISKQDIVTAIKNSKVFLRIPSLKDAEPTLTSRGIPFFYAGGFNLVFQLNHNHEKWAFRVWHIPVGNLKDRFIKISSYLEEKSLPYFSKFIYDEEGLLVNGQLVDTIRMEWVEGSPLKDYIEQNLHDSSVLNKLANDFLNMTIELHDNNISHGDLQHGNIVVEPDGQLRLVDYDSLCIPELEGEKQLVTGLKGYQHPSRFSTQRMSLKADYFSELVIYLSILAIADNPSLWEKYKVSESETLLFDESDFQDFENSDIYEDLCYSNELILSLTDCLSNYIQEKDFRELIPITSTFQTPIISMFESENIFVYPKQEVTLSWNVFNADKVKLVIEDGEKFDVPCSGTIKFCIWDFTTRYIIDNYLDFRFALDKSIKLLAFKGSEIIEKKLFFYYGRKRTELYLNFGSNDYYSDNGWGIGYGGDTRYVTRFYVYLNKNQSVRMAWDSVQSLESIVVDDSRSNFIYKKVSFLEEIPYYNIGTITQQQGFIEGVFKSDSLIVLNCTFKSYNKVNTKTYEICLIEGKPLFIDDIYIKGLLPHENTKNKSIQNYDSENEFLLYENESYTIKSGEKLKSSITILNKDEIDKFHNNVQDDGFTARLSNEVTFMAQNRFGITEKKLSFYLISKPTTAPKIKYFKADRDEIFKGDTVKLSWLVDNAEEIQIDDATVFLARKDASLEKGKINKLEKISGSIDFVIAKNQTFKIKAVNSFGISEHSININLVKSKPIIGYYTAPKFVKYGDSIEIECLVKLADKVYLNENEIFPHYGFGGYKRATENYIDNNGKLLKEKWWSLYKSQEFTISARNEFGTTEKKFNVQVVFPKAPALKNFKMKNGLSDRALLRGAEATLIYEVEYADKLFLDGELVENHKVELKISPQKNHKYNLRAKNDHGVKEWVLNVKVWKYDYAKLKDKLKNVVSETIFFVFTVLYNLLKLPFYPLILLDKGNPILAIILYFLYVIVLGFAIEACNSL